MSGLLFRLLCVFIADTFSVVGTVNWKCLWLKILLHSVPFASQCAVCPTVCRLPHSVLWAVHKMQLWGSSWFDVTERSSWWPEDKDVGQQFVVCVRTSWERELRFRVRRGGGATVTVFAEVAERGADFHGNPALRPAQAAVCRWSVVWLW
jgi:hypothetical protein